MADEVTVSAQVMDIVKRYAARVCTHDFSLDERLASLGMTSVQIIDMLVDLERSFGIVFTDEELNPATFDTVRALTSVIRSHMERS